MAQGIRIAAVLDAFLEDQHRQASARAATSSEEIVSLLRHCLERYGYESLGRADRTRFETAFAKGDEEAFCKGFGPEHILGHLDVFLYYFMVHKVMANRRLLRAAGSVTGVLAAFLYDQGYVGEAERASAVELAARAARDLPRADRLADLLYKQSSQLPDFDPAELPESDWLEGCLVIEAVEPDALFFDGGIGPVATCDEAARLAEPGWVVNVVLARLEGSWRVIEVGNVSPAWG